ncbi:hypothetical protein NDU88_004162 [Pleurodeles waltl]|uniref:Uncharacterized protein n=1 Tax=Pleurodeles waltl TaxID=8319 RepID=A0AAV7WUJ0_PLEWA|nr:hypothetical protein NDU88_004162 [Pleurodeles waltl]
MLPLRYKKGAAAWVMMKKKSRQFTGTSINIMSFANNQELITPPCLKPARVKVFAYRQDRPLTMKGRFTTSIRRSYTMALRLSRLKYTSQSRAKAFFLDVALLKLLELRHLHWRLH